MIAPLTEEILHVGRIVREMLGDSMISAARATHVAMAHSGTTRSYREKQSQMREHTGSFCTESGHRGKVMATWLSVECIEQQDTYGSIQTRLVQGYWRKLGLRGPCQIYKQPRLAPAKPGKLGFGGARVRPCYRFSLSSDIRQNHDKV